MRAYQCDRCKAYFNPEIGTIRGLVHINHVTPAGTICEKFIKISDNGNYIDLCDDCKDSFNDWWHQVEGGS